VICVWISCVTNTSKPRIMVIRRVFCCCYGIKSNNSTIVPLPSFTGCVKTAVLALGLLFISLITAHGTHTPKMFFRFPSDLRGSALYESSLGQWADNPEHQTPNYKWLIINTDTFLIVMMPKQCVLLLKVFITSWDNKSISYAPSHLVCFPHFQFQLLCQNSITVHYFS